GYYFSLHCSVRSSLHRNRSAEMDAQEESQLRAALAAMSLRERLGRHPARPSPAVTDVWQAVLARCISRQRSCLAWLAVIVPSAGRWCTWPSKSSTKLHGSSGGRNSFPCSASSTTTARQDLPRSISTPRARTML